MLSTTSGRTGYGFLGRPVTNRKVCNREVKASTATVAAAAEAFSRGELPKVNEPLLITTALKRLHVLEKSQLKTMTSILLQSLSIFSRLVFFNKIKSNFLARLHR
jgi:hypothetical protein